MGKKMVEKVKPGEEVKKTKKCEEEEEKRMGWAFP
jgi:hypothetical protein